MLNDKDGPGEQPAPQQDGVQHERDQAERDAGDAATVGSVLAGAIDARREPCGTSQIARKNDDG